MSKTARQAGRVTGCSNCHTCAPNRIGGPMRMIVCPECGYKRCPKANDCRNACTGSNEPGQTGSAYPAVQTLDEARVQRSTLVSTIKSEWRTDHVEDILAMVQPQRIAELEDERDELAIGMHKPDAHAPTVEQIISAIDGCEASRDEIRDMISAALADARRDAGGIVTVCQRPCRTCGPDGCADSVACPSGAR